MVLYKNIRFSVDALLNIIKSLTNARQLKLPGATHSDDTFYVFR